MLAIYDFPSSGPARAVLIVHGLFGSARNWNAIAKRLSDRGPVVSVDMRNHGSSAFTRGHSYAEMAEDLAEVINAKGAPMDVIGHSMGGKAAMMLALGRPELMGRLIVADIAPVGYGHTQRPLIDAMRTLDPTKINTRAEADAALSAEIEDPSVRAFLLQSLDLKEGRWRLNLDVLAQEMDKIIGFPETKGEYNGPTLFLSGGMSDYMKPDDRTEAKSLFPKAKFAKIPGAGHWLHAEKPREFEAAVRVFLEG